MMLSVAALLCPLVGFAFMVAIIVAIVRAVGRTTARTAAQAPRPPISAATRLAEDGFWLSSFEPGVIVYYQYWAADAKSAGQIVFQPGNDGRQFVYTGARPERVVIDRVEGATGDFTSRPLTYVENVSTDFGAPMLGAAAAGVVLGSLSNDDPPPADPPSPPSQFPAAY